MSFEDAGGREEIYLRAQRDRRAEIMLDDSMRVGRDRTVKIGRNRRTQIRGDDVVALQTGDYELTAAAGAVTLEAATSMTLKVGVNQLVISQTGITLNGLTITSQAVTMNSVRGLKADVQGVALASVIGGRLILK